ncbi:Glycosyltransferase involved in cell wall bisynthesis [Mucilaginibacter sp. OK268]|uniref:glycosyltransferase family 2 protein n=1 Tax=Mucilaginibacter sp. OK268 TaxID=1881048 RepID=UPI000888B0C6|nr:glycosyltransferase family A protein [Mucilaginibacter sp. OK268]SDQ00406.1 Glycosyltransferase involved in cell wall bisynthesis [Mucilaginibacter sp. OK268]
MEKNTPLVSVCMPAYNAGEYIADTVKSISGQSYTNWELIIVNDGSTDDTAAILNQLTDTRIKVFHQENKGQCAAANWAFQLSNGELIKFMDADDLLSPNYIQNQVSAINGDDGVIAFAAWGRFYNNSLASFQLDDDFLKTSMKPAEWLIASMIGKQVMLQCALWLIPRKLLEASGLWNETLSLINDFEFFIRVLLCAHELRFTNDAILYYRSGLAQSLSATTSARGAESAYNSVDLGTQHLLNYEASDRVKKIAADCFQRLVYTFYPQHPVIVQKAELKVKELGGSSIAFPAGGYTKILASVLGWKATQYLKFIFKKRA